MRAALAVPALMLVLLAAVAPANAAIGEAALRRHIAVLADDRLGGRKPGTPGGRAAERYVARAFAAAGLRPGAGGGRWLQPVRLRAKGAPAVTADNVIGRIAGRDPRAGTILLLAHWDHLGLCAPPGAADRICNGAVDNASGVAVLIEVARALAAGPRPRRGVLFVATTGEEMGLLGAKALARRPPVPLAGILAAINLDTVAIAPRGAPVTIVGRGMTRLDPLVDATARALGRTVDPGTAANAFVRRQDGWALLAAGVPAIMVGGAYGSDRLARFLAGRYHHPDDDLASGIELGGAAEDADLLVALVRALADPARFAAVAGASPGLDSPPASH